MTIENSATRWLIVTLLILLLVPLVVAVGMMIAGVGMMAQMGGMMGGAGMALCLLWAVLVAAVLFTLIALLVRGTAGPARSTGEARSPLAH